MANIVEKVVELSDAPGTTDSNSADFDLLREAVLAANLAGTLSDPNAEYTVFAPNDGAFIGLAQTLGYGGSDEGGSLGYILDALALLGGGDPIPTLQAVLTYHVTPGKFLLADVVALGDGAMIPTLQGGELTLDLDAPGLGDLDPGLPDPNIILTDVDASNGVIHALDGVLLPISVSGILSQPGTDLEIGDDGRDFFRTKGGNDFIDGNGGNDILRAGSGDDIAIGGAGFDWIGGGHGADILLGEEGNDRIFGGGGDDIINGGSGNDWMASGGGNDIFVFTNGSGNDKVVAFRNGKDKIDLSGYDGIDDFSDIADGISGGRYRSKIELEDGDSITLIGFGAGHIDQSDFVFS